MPGRVTYVGRTFRSVAAGVLLWSGTSLCASVLVVGGATVTAQELVDRSLAVVAGQVVTLSDTIAARTLGLAGGADPDDQQAATERLIERLLMLREVRNYAPPDPALDLLQRRLGAVRARFASDAAFAEALRLVGFSDARLEDWIRDDLRIESYVQSRFAATAAPNENDIAALYEQERAAFERDGLSRERALALIRERLAEQRRSALVARWVEDLKRRAEIRRITP